VNEQKKDREREKIINIKKKTKRKIKTKNKIKGKITGSAC